MAEPKPRCGRPTKTGEPCPLLLLGGKCPTHDVDLKKRNRKVRAAYQARDPEGYRQHQVAAGANGAAATIERHGYLPFVTALANKQRANPSEPEKWLINVLKKASMNGYEFQKIIEAGENTYYVLDFYWPDVLIELDGWRFSEAPWGLNESKMIAYRQRLFEKIAYMESIGCTCLVLEYEKAKRAELAAIALAFLNDHLKGTHHDEEDEPEF